MDLLFSFLSYFFSWVGEASSWIALATLIFLEIVLGIDNLVFLSILVAKLPAHQQDKGRILGLLFAMLTRILLLSLLFWVAKLNNALFYIYDFGVSGRDIVLMLGGLFLLYKSTSEIHSMINHNLESSVSSKSSSSFFVVIIQIAILDIVFSLDSVITAVGMVDVLPIMIIAVVASVIVMLFTSKWISKFIENNPTIKVLALSFLMLVGVTLIADALHFHIPKGYVYFAIIFSLSTESINIYIAKKRNK